MGEFLEDFGRELQAAIRDNVCGETEALVDMLMV